MKCECGEVVRLKDADGLVKVVHAEIKADIKKGKCKILSIRQMICGEVGTKVQYIDIMDKIDAEEMDELEQAMLAHSRD